MMMTMGNGLLGLAGLLGLLGCRRKDGDDHRTTTNRWLESAFNKIGSYKS